MTTSECQGQGEISDHLVYVMNGISALWLCFLLAVGRELSFEQTQRGAGFRGGSRALEWQLCWGVGLGGGGDKLFEK